MSILQELFFNTAVSITQSPAEQDEWYKKAADAFEESETVFSETLDQRQKYLFMDYLDMTAKLDELIAINYFEQGFRIGVKLMMETLDLQKDP